MLQRGSLDPRTSHPGFRQCGCYAGKVWGCAPQHLRCGQEQGSSLTRPVDGGLVGMYGSCPRLVVMIELSSRLMRIRHLSLVSHEVFGTTGETAARNDDQSPSSVSRSRGERLQVGEKMGSMSGDSPRLHGMRYYSL